jgi:predicted phage-related endonuclease
MESCAKFWRDYVETKTPPPIDGSASCSEWLKTNYPNDARPVVDAPPGAEKWARQLREARAALEVAEAKEKEARNQLVALIGDAAGIRGSDWSVSYRQAKGRASTNWEAVCREAHVSPVLIEKHTARTPYRVFRPKFSGGNDE